jgi:acyl-CoA-binding protein
MDHQDRFAAAQARVKKLSKRPSSEHLLELYGLFKQATEGDVKGSRPGMLDLKGRAKHDAWAARKGMPAAEAMRRYSSLVDELVRALG